MMKWSNVNMKIERRVEKAKIVVAHVRPVVKEVFDITDFSDIFTLA